MRDQRPGPDPFPAPLLEDYLAVAGQEPGALPATALRTASVGTRVLLARAAAGGSASLAQLVTAARRGPAADLVPESIEPGGLTELARVIALQDILPGDRTDGLALFDMALQLFGPSAIPPEHQGLHAQLAYRLGDHLRAAVLLDVYPQVSAQVAWDLRVDLANPFGDPATRGAAARTPALDWFEAFQSLLPLPHPALTPQEEAAPFDRLVATGVRRIDAQHRISVVVATYRPGLELLTAVRSIVDQSWSNLEILVVDDGSPPEHQQILRQCEELDERVRLIQLENHRGEYAARNVGLGAAAGDFIAFQGAGDWSHPRRLERQIVPLVQDPEVHATVTDGMYVTDELVVTRPGRPARSRNLTSLLLRKEVVLRQVGYLDQVHSGADREYYRRIIAALGGEAVRHDKGDVYTLVRRASGALSHDGFRVGWTDPVQAAYQSAYHLWHQRIRAGTASAYLAEHPARRPFPLPASIRRHTAGRGRATSYDAIFVSDWRPLRGVQKSMLEEIRALTRWGMRVGVVQLEALRFMTRRRRRLCPPIQELINDGTVDHVQLSDDIETALLIVRYPPVLQFAASEPSRIRAKQVMIQANETPCERDGTDYTFVPLTCHEIARTLFSVEPRWCPDSPVVREFLEAALPPAAVTPFDIPGILDADRWWVDRNRFRLDRPVIGRHSRDDWAAWPADRETLLAAYPDSAEVDVRIMGGARTARAVIGRRALPPNWVAYEYDEIDVRSFLNQLDYFVYFPHAGVVETMRRAVLEAMATGCVILLPHQFSAIFGDAAVYCHPHEVLALVQAFHSDWTSYFDQSRRALARVERLHCHDAYLDVISSIVAEREHGTRNPEPVWR
jgi:glycosyl transferase family 2